MSSSAPTDGGSPPGVPTERSRSGKPRATRSPARCAATSRMSPAWRSVPMAGGWRPPVPIRPSRSGTPRRTPRCSPGGARSGRSRESPSSPTGTGCSWPETSRTLAGRVRHRLTISIRPRECMKTTLEDAERRRSATGRSTESPSGRDGRLVASASQSGRIEAWTVGTQRSCFRYEETTSRFQDVAFSPDGRKLAAAGQINARTENGEAGPNRHRCQRPGDRLRPGNRSKSSGAARA